MGATTTRRGFYKAGGGSTGNNGADEAADIDIAVNNNLDKIDSILGVPTLASTSAFPVSPFAGDRCIVGNVEYRYTGTAWRPWNSLWVTYTPSLQNVNLGGNSASTQLKWRWESGRVRVLGKLQFGTSPSMSGQATIGLPFTNKDDYYVIGSALYVTSSGTVVNGFAQVGANQGTYMYLSVWKADGTFAYNSAMTNNSPAVPSANDYMFVDVLYESYDNPLS